MPVLAAETQWHPDNLFSEGDSPVPAGHVWWVLHVKPRQEKSIARELLKREVAFYLPLVTRRWRSRTRTMASHLPLFAGYVFSRCDRAGRLTALSTQRVVRCLEVDDQTRLWGDLQQINRLIRSGAAVTSEARLVPGTPVEIDSGPLMGMKGKIIRSASGRRFLVEVDFIGRGASVLLEDGALTRLT
jgi:transcriptional antiterminator RfaH